mmetsp:Transcript_43509/g.109087  ORF Transcript_43509/g.109087 Transcript_43509/m.109087 type:complete len:273 (+) Transcript_43509:212-1030(+)
MEALLLHIRRHPVRLGVVLQQAVLNGGHLDKPGGHRPVDEGRVGAPAEGVRVIELRHVKQAAGRLDVRHDVLVRLLHVHSLEVGDGVHKARAGVQRAGQLRDVHNLVVNAHAIIVLAKGGRLVHDAGTAVVCHVGVAADPKRASVLHRAKVRKQRRIGLALELAALELGDDLKALVLVLLLAALLLLALLRDSAWDMRHTALGKDVDGARFGVLCLDVVKVGVDTEREVGGQRPGRGGPRDERRAVRVAVHRKAHHHRGVVHVLVVLSRLEV